MALWNVYVGTFTKELGSEIDRLSANPKVFNPPTKAIPSEGIEHFSFDDANGTLLRQEDVTGDVLSPQYLDVHPTLPVIYAAEFTPSGRLTAFSVDESGTLERRSTTESLGDMAVAVSVHPSGTFVYVAHWGDGAVTAFPLDAEGTVLGADPIVPGTPTREANFEPRHHQVRVTPSGTGILVADVGRNEINAYRTDPHGRLSTDPVVRIEFPPGCAPRHLEFHPSGRFVYAVGEVDSMLYVLEAEDWMPSSILSRCSTLPSHFHGSSRASELDLHPDGHTLYVGNRGADSLTIFSVGSSGEVKPIGHQPCLGESPRAVRVDPTGRYLLVANKESCKLVVFQIEEDRRILHPVGKPAEAQSPSSVVFVKAGPRAEGSDPSPDLVMHSGDTSRPRTSTQASASVKAPGAR